MAVLIPETATRLQVMAFVSDAELAATERNRLIRVKAEQMAEQALRKLLSDCIKTEGDYMGFQGQMLRLDVYVLSPEEIHKMIADAIRQGRLDAMYGMKGTAYE